MFGGGKKNKSRSQEPKRSKNDNLSMMFGMGGPPDDDDDDDENLLAELAALEGNPPSKKKGNPEKKLMSMDAINKMTANVLRDISDDDDDDDDIDENELLAELEGFSDVKDSNEEVIPPAKQSPKKEGGSDNKLVQLLNERKDMYTIAIQEAKAEASTTKARRYERGLKEIDAMLKKANKGIAVSEDEIPPPVVIKKSKPSNTQTLPGTPLSQNTTAAAPIQPVSSGFQERPIPTARPQPQVPQETPKPMPRPQVSKDVTPSTSIDTEKINALVTKQKQFKTFALQMKHEGKMEDARKFLAISKQFDGAIAAVKDGKDFDLSSIPDLPPLKPAAKPTVTEPKEITDESKTENSTQESSIPSESSETQYETRPFDYDELPCPFGYPPLPILSSKPDVVAPPAAAQQSPQSIPQPVPANQQPSQSQVTQSRNEKEYNFLLNRRKEFKMAALQAKKNGDMNTAREYLKQSIGVDQMIEASRNGLCVDITTVPSLKRATASIKRSGSSSEEIGIIKEAVQLHGSDADQYVETETALKTQIQDARLKPMSSVRHLHPGINGSPPTLNVPPNTGIMRGGPLTHQSYMIKPMPSQSSMWNQGFQIDHALPLNNILPTNTRLPPEIHNGIAFQPVSNQWPNWSGQIDQ